MTNSFRGSKIFGVLILGIIISLSEGIVKGMHAQDIGSTQLGQTQLKSVVPTLEKPRPIGSPDLPQLITPVANATITGPGVVFSWQAGPGSPLPTSYRVCVAEEGQSCNSLRAWNYPGQGQAPLTGKTLKTNLAPSLYQGKRLTWTVAACAPNPNLPVLGGGSADLCAYANPRPLTWALPAPILGQPDDQVQLTGPRPQFSIPPVSGAETYLFCVSQPGVACPSTNTWTSKTVVAQVSASSASWYPGRDITQFTGQTVHWTAAACNRISGCVYQQNVRAISFPPIMVPMYIRVHSQYDVNQFWVTRGGGPGYPYVEEIFIPDLVPARDLRIPGTSESSYYDLDLRVLVPKRHDPGQEPAIRPYYSFQFMMAPEYFGQRDYIKVYGFGFAPGVKYFPEYTLVRETIFILGYDAWPRWRLEQLLRGPDGRLYVHRPCCDSYQTTVPFPLEEALETFPHRIAP